jgi:uncharacterized protein YlxW (UPF0749 family)
MRRVYFGIVALCVACSSRPQAQSIDAPKAKSFVAYQEKLIPLERKWAKADKPVSVTEELDAVRASTGLTEQEIAGLSQIGAVITVRNEALNKRLAKVVVEQQQTVARSPDATRAEAQKSLENLEHMRANVFELQEMRQRYGDAIVDAMLEQEAELNRQRLELASVR